jgi:UPF0716 protein FxsA
LPSWLSLRTAVLLWLVTEVLTLALVVSAIGWTGAIVLGLVTSFIGLVTLRRLGRNALAGLRSNLAGAIAPDRMMMDGTLSGIGAVLLLLPGFATDLVGLALAAPSVRGWALRTFGIGPSRRRPGTSDTIDLGPQDWRPIGDTERSNLPPSR